MLRYADQGRPLVLTTTLANGVAEEVFFRGSVYAAAGATRPVLSTAVYGLATTATRNPALVLASVPMGLLFAQQRRSPEDPGVHAHARGVVGPDAPLPAAAVRPPSRRGAVVTE